MDSKNIIIKQYKQFSYICGSFLIVSGIVYGLFQIFLINKISDSVFISLTIGESLFALFIGKFILDEIINNELSFNASTISIENLDKGKIEYEKLIKIFVSFRKYLPIIFTWAVIMGIFPILQNYRDNYVVLKILLGVFLFFTNLITAYFVIVIASYLILSHRLWYLVKVKLWKRDCSSANFLFALSQKIALSAAFYMTLSLTAWLTSPEVHFDLGILIFIIFSIILLICSIIIPSRPYIRKRLEAKTKELNEIDNQIQEEYELIITELKGKSIEIKLEKINSLIQIRNKIESIYVYPFGVKTLITSLSIIAASLLPILFEYLIKYIIYN